MADGSEAVAFRLWPPVAIGAYWIVGWLVTQVWDDPVGLGRWRVARFGGPYRHDYTRRVRRWL